ncbi:Mesoderm induction early response protein 1 [Pseudolycoriella hygida]|uniref:Mesoderm induction early response protein 1 n=1 Tax=Pseudolycoriella hygida TaxID=35572 RepID=A0A9Q0MZY0_9DIPT|nr:Mesoderm induction early response protein 1 [Pseudolycoriella hygida]
MTPPAMTAVPTNQSSSSAAASATSMVQAASANSPSSSSSTSQRNANNSNHNNGDSLFEPSVDMMVNDFDDERTLEEEEALAATEAEDPSTELSNLQREGDMPIEELLALYRCPNRSDDDANDADNERRQSSSSGSPNDLDLDESDVRNLDKDDIDDDEDESELRKLYPETFADDQRHLRTLARPLSEEEEDGDYSPDEDEVKKTIMVGSEFQAVIPEGLCKYGDELPYENEDKLVWDPSKLKEREVENYQRKTYSIANDPKNSNPEKTTTVLTVPLGGHMRDDEQMLFLLLQCGHNVDEALRRRRISVASGPAAVAANEMSEWSEEECRNFECGLRMYGKDFHTIQQLKVKTRSVGELVQFYYLWKKTERHDIFANKARLEKKKYNLHPGLTDYMDRFLEEQESSGSGGNGTMATNNGGTIGIRDRSSSPGVNSLMYNSYRKSSYRSSTGASNDTLVTDSAISDNDSSPTKKSKESSPSHLNTLTNSSRL